MPTEIGRLITAMVTPFDADGQVDYEQAKRLALALIDSGSDGLVVTGTTGEGPALSMEEKARLYGEVKDAIGSRGAVIAGTSDNNTAASIELSREANRSAPMPCCSPCRHTTSLPKKGCSSISAPWQNALPFRVCCTTCPAVPV